MDWVAEIAQRDARRWKMDSSVGHNQTLGVHHGWSAQLEQSFTDGERPHHPLTAVPEKTAPSHLPIQAS